jgi:UDP-galactopyranose mutase
LNQRSDNTIIVHETTTDDGDPYYPVPNAENQALYEKYRELAEEEERTKGVGFVGRLASYKYFNMDQAIRAALDFYHIKIKRVADGETNSGR